MENISQLIVATQPPSLIFTLIFFCRKSSESEMSGLFLLTISCVCSQVGAFYFSFLYAFLFLFFICYNLFCSLSFCFLDSQLNIVCVHMVKNEEEGNGVLVQPSEVD